MITLKLEPAPQTESTTGKYCLRISAVHSVCRTGDEILTFLKLLNIINYKHVQVVNAFFSFLSTLWP